MYKGQDHMRRTWTRAGVVVLRASVLAGVCLCMCVCRFVCVWVFVCVCVCVEVVASLWLVMTVTS